MINFYYSKFELVPNSALNAKASQQTLSGALIGAFEQDSLVGLSNLVSHPSIGDASLDELLAGSSLLQIAKERALEDFQFRQDSKQKVLKVQSNALVSNFLNLNASFELQSEHQKFKRFKIKLNADYDGFLSWIKQRDLPPESLRLDFNSSLNFDQAQQFILKLSQLGCLKLIEYIEDICEWNEGQWRELNKMAPLALDLNAEFPTDAQGCFRYVVIKPTRLSNVKIEEIIVNQTLTNISQKTSQMPSLKIVFTSAMDHQVGILQAMRTHTIFSEKYPANVHPIGGFLTAHLFESFPLAELTVQDSSELSSVRADLFDLSSFKNLTWSELC